MAILNMGGSGSSRFYQEVITGTGEAVFLSDDVNTISIGIIPAAGAGGKAQYSLSPKSVLEASAGTWRDWPSGVVTVTTDDTIIGPVTAVRGVASTGTIKLEVVG